MIIGISLFFISIGAFLFIVQKISRNKKRTLQKIEKEPKIAILIPASFESLVIESLLDSIQKQSVPISNKDIYVIIESLKDPTYEIAKKRGITVIERKGKIHRKGYALDEAVQFILKEKIHYDLYFILDADNRVSKDFIEKILVSYKKGYQVGVGYRCPLNPEDSVVSASSSLIFLLLNSILNKDRMRKNRSVILSGTGFFIRGDLIESLEGYPFHTLTEDYELSLYCTVNAISSTYNEEAIFYDEQPISFQKSMIQRTRWIKGFLEVRYKYVPILRKELMKKDFPRGVLNDLIGITPILFLLFGILFYLGYDLFCMTSCFLFQSTLFFHFLFEFFVILMSIYFILQLVTLFILIKEKKNLNLSFSMKIKVFFYHPFFLISYVPCALKAIFTKNITWKKIEHYGNKKKNSSFIKENKKI